MEFYLIFILFYFVIGLWETGQESLPLFNKSPEPQYTKTALLMLPMFLVVAFRGEHVGSDTFTYVNMYSIAEAYEDYATALIESRLEPGYLYLTYFLSHHGFGYHVLQVIETAFIYFSWTVFFARYSSRVAVSVFFFALTTWLSTANVVRMHLAIAILLFALPYILNRKPWKFFLILLIASMFHKSAIVFGVMYPLCVINYNKYLTSLILIVSVVIAYMGATFFETVTETIGMYEEYVDGRYFDEDRSITGAVLKIGVQLVIFLYFTVRGILMPIQHPSDDEDLNEGQDEEEDDNYSINLSYFCVFAFWIMLALAIIGLSNNIMNRLSGYYSVVIMLLMPMAFDSYEDNVKRRLFYILISVSYIIQWSVIMIYRPHWNNVVPYVTFF